MKRKHILYILALLASQTVSAQEVGENDVKTSEVTLREAGDKLLVNLRLMPGKNAVKKMERVTVTPVLTGETGEYHTLEPFMMYGKSRRKLEIRQARLGKRSAPTEMKEYNYQGAFPFQSWMEEARLVLDVRKTTCADCPAGSTRVQLPTMVELIPKVPYVMRPITNFVMPEPEPIKNRAESGSARIGFLSGKSVIVPGYKDNTAELMKINTAIRQVMADSLAKVSSIVLTAYASPEGSYVTNEKLSKARAEALKVYVQTNNSLKGVSIKTMAVAEDWETLREMIAKSEYAWKDAAMKIIDETPVMDGREAKLMRLEGGNPYRMMLAEWFPQLRRTDYLLDYSVRDFTVDQGRAIIRTRPAQMSLNEMFHVANSYEKGSPEFNEVFDIAVRLFPQDPVANINAAAAAIGRGDTAMAEKYLEKVAEDLRAENNRAAYYMTTGELEKAKECLTKAGQQTQEVKHNLGEIKLKEENNTLLEKYRKR